MAPLYCRHVPAQMGPGGKQHGAPRHIASEYPCVFPFTCNYRGASVSHELNETFNDAFSRHEPLRQELRPYLEQTELCWFIRHPFYNEPVYDLEKCAYIHQKIDCRTAQADACFEDGDWEGYLQCVEVPSQPEWFAKDAYLFQDDRYWCVLSRVYQGQWQTHKNRELFDRLFRADRPGRENLMDPDERRVLARLPDVLTVYRGYAANDCEGFADGIAWTLSRRRAVWYANWKRDSDNPTVITGEVRKEDVWAYCDGGGLLLPPETVFAKQHRRAWCPEARVCWGDYIKKPFDVEAYIRKA